MTKMAKLLIYLNPDVADLYSVGLYLYGPGMDIDERQVKARGMISGAKQLGWEILGDSKHGYALSEDHYGIVQADQDWLCGRRSTERLTPDSVILHGISESEYEELAANKI